jgi:hypothetical protein
VEFFHYRFHGDVRPDSYDVYKAASSASSYFVNKIRQYNLFEPNEDHVDISYQIIIQEGIFQYYDI